MRKPPIDDEGLNAALNAMKEVNGTFPASAHLARINQANNQLFFLNGFSHMFNNPLNTILLGGELLQNFVAEIESLFDMLECEPEHPASISSELREKVLLNMPDVIDGISASARRLNLFVSHLSEFTANGVKAEKQDLNLNQLASLCVSMTDHQIRAYTDNFRLDLETDLPAMSGNAQQLLQVILSLLMNSLLSLSDRSSEVVLSTACDHDTRQVQLCMRDAGSGISPDVLPHINEPFFTTWGKHGCLGLGLTVADRIIRGHGGELSIDSAPGKGTSARVSLPVHKRTAAAFKKEQDHG